MSGFFLYTEVLLSSIIDRKATEGNQEGGSVMSNTLQNLFEKYQKDGILTMGNDMVAYFGAL